MRQRHGLLPLLTQHAARQEDNEDNQKAGKKNRETVAPIPNRWAPPNAQVIGQRGKNHGASAGPPLVKI